MTFGNEKYMTRSQALYPRLFARHEKICRYVFFGYGKPISDSEFRTKYKNYVGVYPRYTLEQQEGKICC